LLQQHPFMLLLLQLSNFLLEHQLSLQLQSRAMVRHR
jgi:hypothetical protein